MKKYICLALSIGLALFATKFDWYLSGNEAVAATQQVLNGSDYAVGRTTQAMWNTIQQAVGYGAGFFGVLAAYFFTSDIVKKQNEKDNETEQ